MDNLLIELNNIELELNSGLISATTVSNDNICNICNKNFKGHEHNYRLHILKCEEKKIKRESKYVCSVCNRDFGNNKNNRDIHMKKCGVVVDSVLFSFQCQNCPKKYTSKKCAVKHQAICC